jgi:hypothetical protein
MLLRTIAGPALGAVLVGTLACDPCKEKPAEDTIQVDGFELYNSSYDNTVGSIRIFHDGNGALHLVNVEEGRLVQEGQVRATLTPEALVMLDSTVAQLESGAQLGGFDASCLAFVDAPISRLSLPAGHSGLQFTYPLHCAPPLLAALDEMCRELIAALPTCSPSPWVQDCQLVD